MDCSTMESLKQVRISEFKQVRLLGRRLALQPLRLQWIIVAVGGLCLLLNAASMAQDRQADRARALLKQGIEQYKSLNFKQAQVTFLKIDASRLTPAERKKLDSYRSKVNDAIKKQAEALEAYDQAVEALKANQLEKARDLFEKVASSEFVPEAVRKDARAQRALMIRRIKEAKAKEIAAKKHQRIEKSKPPTKSAGRPDTPTTAPTTKPTKKTVAKAEEQKKLQDKKKQEEAARLAEELQARLDRAKTLVAKGNTLLDEGKVEEAIKCFKEAIKVAPEYKLAQERLGFAQSLLGSSSGLSMISRLERIRRIRKEQTEVRFNKALKKAREAIQAPRSIEDFEKAEWEVNTAQTLLETNKELFTDTEYRAMKVETEKLLDFISQVRS